MGKANEPELFARIHKIMLPGDFIALRFTGELLTTYSGLQKVSSGIFFEMLHRQSF